MHLTNIYIYIYNQLYAPHEHIYIYIYNQHYAPHEHIYIYIFTVYPKHTKMFISTCYFYVEDITLL